MGTLPRDTCNKVGEMFLGSGQRHGHWVQEGGTGAPLLRVQAEFSVGWVSLESRWDACGEMLVDSWTRSTGTQKGAHRAVGTKVASDLSS